MRTVNYRNKTEETGEEAREQFKTACPSTVVVEPRLDDVSLNPRLSALPLACM